MTDRPFDERALDLALAVMDELHRVKSECDAINARIDTLHGHSGLAPRIDAMTPSIETKLFALLDHVVGPWAGSDMASYLVYDCFMGEPVGGRAFLGAVYPDGHEGGRRFPITSTADLKAYIMAMEAERQAGETQAAA